MPRPHPRRTRNVAGLLLLAVVLGAMALELKARRDLAAASDAVDQLMATHHHQALSRATVEAAIGKTPVGPLGRSGMEREATYTWRGLRVHSLKAFYMAQEDGEESLIRIEAE